MSSRTALHFLLGLWMTGALGSACQPAPRQHPAPGLMLFTNVHVIPMDEERMLSNDQILVQEGIIVEMGPEIKAPADVRIIDGHGGFLLPGLIDAHVHIKDKADLDLYLVHGVTTVRNMRGEPRLLRWRDAIEAGKLRGPTIRTSAPTIQQEPSPYFHTVTTPEAARASV